MFVVIFLILVTFLLLGGHLAGWIDRDTLQTLGWIATIVGVIAASLQFIFPLATSFGPIPSPTELAEVPPTAQPTNEPVPTAPQPTVTLRATIQAPTETPAPPTVTSQPTTPPPPEPTPTLGIGSTMVGQDGMTLVYVPEGEFLMGSRNDDPYAHDDEKPQHTVYLDAFWIDQTEVTNEMFAAFLNAQGNREEGVTWLEIDSEDALIEWQGEFQPKKRYAYHPVVKVSWFGALAYCHWAERRLPTEAEWEKAAGGLDGRKWPWGNEPPNDSLANIGGHVGDTTPVGSYSAGASPYSALDMVGNVWEWVNDTFDGSYYAFSPKDNPQGPTLQGSKVLRGGSWGYSASYARVRDRHGGFVSDRVYDWGFRCARSP